MEQEKGSPGPDPGGAEQVTEQKRIPPGTILVVEDSKPMSAVVQAMFRSFGFNVLELRSGDEAKALCASVPEIELLNIDMIFSDYMMPGMDGLKLLEFVRSHPVIGHVPFVMATAAASEELVKKAKSLKVTAFFVKPISHKRLLDLTQKLFPGRSVQSTEGER